MKQLRIVSDYFGGFGRTSFPSVVFYVVAMPLFLLLALASIPVLGALQFFGGLDD